jgi:ComF family protein
MRARRLQRALSAATEAARLALDWVYPPHCAACEEPLQGHEHMLCPECLSELARARIDGPLCSTCGLPLDIESEEDRCLACRAQKRHFQSARALFVYREPVRTIVQHYKFHGDFHLGPRLLRACLYGRPVPEALQPVDAVVALPLHPRRRRQRGYDQALMLARVVAEHLQLPVLRGAVARRRYTAQQSLLPFTQRRDNVRGAFECGRPDRVKGCRLLLVDDVMTTCATADECSRALMRGGAQTVHVLALARAVP